MADITPLKEAIKETYSDDEPHWKAYGRIQIKTGIDLRETDEVEAERVPELRRAAEEVTGTTIEV